MQKADPPRSLVSQGTKTETQNGGFLVLYQDHSDESQKSWIHLNTL